MNPFINTFMLQETTISSNSLGVLATLCHKIDQEGRYILTIFFNQKEIRQLPFACNEVFENTQLDIDLYEVHNSKYKSNEVLNIKKDGYLVLFVSEGAAGYHFSITKLGDKPIVTYNSQKLQPDDFFSVTVLQPGNYLAQSKELNATCKLVVTPLKMANEPQPEFSPITIVVKEGFDKNEVALTSTQGLNFHILSQCSIIITKQESSQMKDIEVQSRKVSWRGGDDSEITKSKK